MLAHQLLLISLLPLIHAQETVLGVYVFHRHGDRTAKSWPPTKLTDLGYTEVYSSGNFFRNRYIDSSADFQITGISTDVVKTSQLSIEAPSDTVLQNSATGFLQGLYPPVGSTLSTQELANGTNVTSPLDGYQLIPVNTVSTAASTSSSETTTWLQGSSGCNNAVISSNNYLVSEQYLSYLNSTKSFYSSLLPVINGTFTSSTAIFKNAYTIFDLINVATIDNTTIQSEDLLTNSTIRELQVLANIHEYGLAYNRSEPIRAIAGSTLAAQIVQALNSTITGKSATTFNAQFGAYASFLSFFGLAQLDKVSDDFTGIVDYAASMTFELITNSTVSSSSYPSTDDIYVRFLFSNGTAAQHGLTAYPLFNLNETVLPWSTFVNEMNQFAIGNQTAWCTACGNSTGTCATSTSTASSSSSTSTGGSKNGGGMSRAVAGVIGAMVTLAVILGLEALILLVGGFRLTKKGSRAPAGEATMTKA
jgi:hypothetical protein